MLRRDFPSAILKLPWGINKDCAEPASADERQQNRQPRRPAVVSRWPSPPDALGCMKMKSARLSFDYHLRNEKCNPFRVCKYGSYLWILTLVSQLVWERPNGMATAFSCVFKQWLAVGSQCG